MNDSSTTARIDQRLNLNQYLENIIKTHENSINKNYIDLQKCRSYSFLFCQSINYKENVIKSSGFHCN